MLALFGVAMTVSFGIKAPLNFSVFVDAGRRSLAQRLASDAKSSDQPPRKRKMTVPSRGIKLLGANFIFALIKGARALCFVAEQKISKPSGLALKQN